MNVNGTLIRTLRAKNGWTVTGLAALAEITQGHLTNIETEARGCGPDVVCRLARVLDVPVELLLRNRDMPDADLVEHLAKERKVPAHVVFDELRKPGGWERHVESKQAVA